MRRGTHSASDVFRSSRSNGCVGGPARAESAASSESGETWLRILRRHRVSSNEGWSAALRGRRKIVARACSKDLASQPAQYTKRVQMRLLVQSRPG